jgi:hypothetical protein
MKDWLEDNVGWETVVWATLVFYNNLSDIWRIFCGLFEKN